MSSRKNSTAGDFVAVKVTYDYQGAEYTKTYVISAPTLKDAKARAADAFTASHMPECEIKKVERY